ncbi:MAG: 16S rRNA (uracil(1498)-N(3))-methyltransferase [Anaerolineaceae bacterium]|nr:16S rRNA (uracil(1498)-N(3))-methyltransferase [Anaerolineaceae bacterium]MBN2678138.1 16S rRNA (uracil(1498)-N(3))-methyltransferase [Anaerolineaceae bacterium]
MHRFFIPAACIQPPFVRLQGETARQIKLVLRLTPGTVITVLDGNPIERLVRLTLVERERVEGEIIAETEAFSEPQIRISLYIAMTQRMKFEWILQKGTELGVNSFIPVITSRSLVRETDSTTHKTERWEGILREAAEQSGRTSIPHLLPVMPLLQALEHGKQNCTICLAAWEKETNLGLKESLSSLNTTTIPSVAVLIGPEGGLSDIEAHQAMAHDWKPISLGQRILRMETAALVITALVMYELGELKPPAGAAADS